MKTEKIAALLRELADALEEEEKTEEKAEEKSKTEEKYTLEEVRKALSAKSGAGFTDQVRELLQKHGASRLSEIKEEEYGTIMKEVQDIGSTQ